MSDVTLARKYVRKSQNAKDRGIEFSLSFSTYKRLINRKTCYYTGIELTSAKDSRPLLTDRTLDRVDNSKGYVEGNVVACSLYANKVKATLENPSSSFEEKHLIKLVKTLGE